MDFIQTFNVTSSGPLTEGVGYLRSTGRNSTYDFISLERMLAADNTALSAIRDVSEKRFARDVEAVSRLVRRTSAISKAVPKKSMPSFLSLSPEIRHKIYHLVLAPRSPSLILIDANPAKPSASLKALKRPALSILLSCKQIHDEAIPIFYSTNHFNLRNYDVSAKPSATIKHLCSYTRKVTVQLGHRRPGGHQALALLKRFRNLETVHVALINRKSEQLVRLVGWTMLESLLDMENMTFVHFRFELEHQQELWDKTTEEVVLKRIIAEGKVMQMQIDRRLAQELELQQEQDSSSDEEGGGARINEEEKSGSEADDIEARCWLGSVASKQDWSVFQ